MAMSLILLPVMFLMGQRIFAFTTLISSVDTAVLNRSKTRFQKANSLHLIYVLTSFNKQALMMKTPHYFLRDFVKMNEVIL